MVRTGRRRLSSTDRKVRAGPLATSMRASRGGIRPSPGQHRWVSPQRDHVRHARRTRRLLWTMLVCATAASTAGNIAHAASHQNVLTASGAVITAAIPPLALLSLTHLAGMWSRISTRGIVYWCFLVAVAGIGAAAFRLSFDALRNLAVQYGYAPADAALFPLLLDGLVAVCTLGLVVLSRIEAPQLDAQGDAHGDAPAPASDASPKLARTLGDASDAGPTSADARDAVRPEPVPSLRESAHGQPRDAAVTRLGGPPVHRDPVSLHPFGGYSVQRDAAQHSGDAPASAHQNALADDDQDAHRRLALHLVDAGRTTVDADVVQAVLARTARGESSRVVAAGVGLSPSSVQRIVKAARDRTPAVVGT